MDTIRTTTPKAAKNVIKAAFNSSRPLFLWGPPGIGKSDIVHQIGNDINAHVIDVRLSLWEPTDIKGIPYFDANEGKMVWGAPAELPDNEMAAKHEHIILFLDEMNSAPPAVQAAAYQLILNRRVGQYQLPDNVLIVAAGNRDSDKGVTYRMPAPLANRFVHVEMAVNFDDWFEWAVNHKVHPDVVGYLNFSKDSLYDFDPKSPNRSFATPRSWSFVSDFLNADVADDTLMDLVSGSVGEGLAAKFMAHRKVASKLPLPTDILEGKVDSLDTKEISAMYSLIISMCYELSQDVTSEGWYNKVDEFLKFSMKHFDTELVVMAMKLALTQYKLPIEPDKVPSFDEFHDKFGKYIKAAQS